MGQDPSYGVTSVYFALTKLAQIVGMTNYRRRFVPGGTYFFTVRLQDAQSDLLTTRINVLRDATKLCMKRWPFDIVGAVVLPNKLHMIWTLPDGDAGFSKRWRLIKSTFSRHVPAPDYIAPSELRRAEKGIWQRRFWEHVIRDADDFDLHMHLIAAAPVHAGLVKRPTDWPYSSLQYRKMDLDPSSPRTTAPVPLAQSQKAAVIAN